MKWTCAFNGLVSTASLLLPLTAVPESHVQTAAPGATLTASTHVNFKIVIPKVLSLQMGDAKSLAMNGETVAVTSNGHSVSLNAIERSANSDSRSRGNVVLYSAARKGIAQNAPCTLGGRPAAAAPVQSRSTSAGDSRMAVCTVAMP